MLFQSCTLLFGTQKKNLSASTKMIEFFDIAQIDNISLRSPNILFSGQNEALHSKPFTFAEKKQTLPSDITYKPSKATHYNILHTGAINSKQHFQNW